MVSLLILSVYAAALLILFLFAIHALSMVVFYLRLRPHDPPLDNAGSPSELPVVTIQLPIYNELHVVRRLLDAICALEYPRHLLEIQLLDDSNDETRALLADLVTRRRAEGFDLTHIHREDRSGYKAGALSAGLARSRGEMIAIFDADFIPDPDFLYCTIPYLQNDPGLGMVQARWEHLNADESLLTRVQAMALDAHFAMEQQVRNRADVFINFNGTAGVWRRSCILDAGNWQSDTLTEDLDLSYRAQLRGWRFLYLNDVTVPAELPSEIGGFKSQQFRWTKGAIETARKHLFNVWKSPQPLRVKLHATSHLTSNLIFPFILLIALLNVPMLLVKKAHPELDLYFNLLSFGLLATIFSMTFHTLAQRDLRIDWRRRMLVYPLFMAGTMGLSVNNSRAVLEALFRHRSEFKRTPKYNVLERPHNWKGSRYRDRRLTVETFIEVLLAIYFLLAIALALYLVELAVIPFQLMFLAGFGATAWLSLRGWLVK